MHNSIPASPEKQAEMLDRILAIGQAVQQEILQDPKKVYQLIVQSACDLAGADCAVIYPYHPSYGEFYDAVNVADCGLRHELPVEEKADKRRRLSARVHRQGEIIREDIQREEPQMLRESSFIAREGIQAFMGLSLRVSDNILGIFYVDYREPHRFTEEEKWVIRLLGQQAASAVSNSWTSQLASIRSDTIARLKAVGETLLTLEDPSRTLNSVLEGIAHSAQEVLGADLVDVYQYIQARHEFILPPTQVGQRWHPHVPKTRIYDDDVVMKAVEIGEPQYFHDAQETALLTGKFVVPRADAPDQRFVVREGVASSAMIPLKVVGETVGVTFVSYRTPQLFGPEQKNVIEALATQAAVAIHNARLFQSERHQRQQSEALRAQILTATLKREEVVGLVLDQLRELVEFDSASVQIIQGDHRRIIGGRGFMIQDAPPELLRDVSQDPLISKIVREKQPMVLGDVEDEPLWDRMLQTAGVNSWIGAPLMVRDQVIGILTLDHGKAGYYTQESGEIVADFASQVATAVHNTDLFQLISDQARALNELSRLASQLVSIGESPQATRNLLEQIARSAQQVLKADLIELYEYLPERNEYRLPQISVGERRGPEVLKNKIHEDDTVFRLIHRKDPLYVEDVRRDAILAGPYIVERESRPIERFVFREGIRSTAAMPLRTGAEVVGLMFASYRTPQAFTQEQREITELLAKQAAIAIHNSRLFNALSRRVTALGTLNQVGQTLTSGLRLQEEEILKLIHGQARELTGTQDMYIALYDEKTGVIRFGLALEKGRPVEIEPRKANMERRGRTEEVIFTHQPLLHRTEQEAEEWYALPRHEAFRRPIAPSWVGVPMMIGGKTLGMIAVYDWEREHAYDELDQQVLASMASQAAIALSNASLYARRVRDLEALSRVGQRLTSGLRWQEEEILELIYEQARELTGTQDMYIALYDEKTGVIRFGLALEKGRPVEIEPRKADMERRGMTEEVIFTKQPLLHRTHQQAKDWYASPGHQEFFGGISLSWLGVPMLVGKRVLGVIALWDWKREHAYDELDQEVLASMASQAAIALDNANLLRQIASAREELIATRQVAALGTATAAIQHRINNTLNIIGPNVARLRKRVDKTDATIQEILDIIERNTKYTSDYITRIQEPLKETEMQRVDVNLCLRDAWAKVWGEYQHRAEFGPVQDIYDLCDSPPPIEASLAQITEIFRNLIENSYKAMGADGGRLTMVSRCVGDRLEVEIQDTGPGIPPNILDKVFVKPVPSKKPGEGSGLGLWLSNLLLQRYAGEISIVKTGPEGTIMLVSLPVSSP